MKGSVGRRKRADSAVYDAPRYYEIAFSFRDIPFECDVLEEAMRRYAKGRVRSVLELGCGNAPHMLELARRGYHYTGLDLNPAMLDYACAKANDAGAEALLLHGDMCDFSLDEPVDFAFVLVGSVYATTDAALHDHFECVAGAVRPGGLYFLEWVVDFDPLCGSGESWQQREDGVTVDATVLHTHVDRVEQLIEEKVILEVDDNGTRHSIEGTTLKRAIYPKEFLLLLEKHPEWRFIGWWDEWSFDTPIDGSAPTGRLFTLLERV